MTMRLFRVGRRRGFSLVEVALVMAVMAVIAAGVAPVAIRAVETRFAERTAREVTQIQDAAKWFFVDTKGWPASLDVLKTGGYLNPNWNGATPWGQAYGLGSTATAFSVAVPVPAGLEGVLTQVVTGPSTTPSGANVVVTSTIPAPGREASLTQFIQRTGDRMSGPLILDNASLGFANGGNTIYSVGLAGANFALNDGSGTTRLGVDASGRTSVSSITGGAAEFGALTGSSGTFSGALQGSSVTGTDGSFSGLSTGSATIGSLTGGSGSFSGALAGGDVVASAAQKSLSAACTNCA